MQRRGSYQFALGTGLGLAAVAAGLLGLSHSTWAANGSVTVPGAVLPTVSAARGEPVAG